MDQAAGAPGHIHPDQIVDFDIYAEPSLFAGVHEGYQRLHSGAPDIFYTPRNGGHWIVTRFDAMSQILRDAEHFSSRELDIPKSNSANVMIPLNLDPPDHAAYRAVLMRHLDRKTIAAMDGKLRAWCARLIDGVKAKGGCDFTEALGAGFPVSVFMELMGMPLERFEEFRGIVHEYFSKTTLERRIELQHQIIGIIAELIEARRANPGEDLVSKLLTDTVHGRPLTTEELQSIGFLLFLGGLDTVANGLTFAIRHLASDPDLQRRLSAQPEKIPDFVEESLRCYGVVNQTRIVKQDVEIAGAHFREGDMVVCILSLAGRDDRKNVDPGRFDIDRERRQHIAFSIGAHTCIGNVLARAEMRTFVEEWLKRIPEFRIAPNAKLEWRPGLVFALPSLPLEWDVAKVR